MVGSPAVNKPGSGDKTIQTEMDRYGYVLTSSKRKGSPQAKTEIKKPNITLQNKFEVLGVEDDKETRTSNGKAEEKPPPIYLREKASNDLLTNLKRTLKNPFFIVPMKKGNMDEIKIQFNSVEDFKLVRDSFDQTGKNYYTYQLKSARGIMIVLKGLESHIPLDEIKEDLEGQGFKIKNIANITNRNKVPQPMFRVELEPSNEKYKKIEDHPIYKIRAVLYRRVTVEQPLKRKAVIQCFNCQEYGHTRGYCRLPHICVICGSSHDTKNCPLDKTSKESATKRFCINCKGNHTANYRGCPVYAHFYDKLYPKQRSEQIQMKNTSPAIAQTTNFKDAEKSNKLNVSKVGTYANPRPEATTE